MMEGLITSNNPKVHRRRVAQNLRCINRMLRHLYNDRYYIGLVGSPRIIWNANHTKLFYEVSAVITDKETKKESTYIMKSNELTWDIFTWITDFFAETQNIATCKIPNSCSH